MDMERQTVNSLYEDAIEFDVPYLAYFIYFAIKKGKITLQDEASKLEDITLTEQEQLEFDKMRTNKILNIRPHQLYAIKHGTNQYVFYFAQNAGEARKLHYQHYGEWVSKLTNAHNQMMDKSLYFPETNETKTFRELLHDTWEFPCRVCELGTGLVPRVGTGVGTGGQAPRPTFWDKEPVPTVPASTGHGQRWDKGTGTLSQNTSSDLEPIQSVAH